MASSSITSKWQIAGGAERLRLQLRARLGANKDTIRTWCKNREAVTLQDFSAAVSALGLKATPAVVRSLFGSLCGGNAPDAITLSVRQLQRGIWSGPGERTGVLDIAVEMGVRPAVEMTAKDDRATRQRYTDENVRDDGVNRFEWEHRYLSYRDAGDPRYETAEALERRIALLRSAPVLRACRQFWDTLRLDEGDRLERAQYEKVHRLLTQALAPEMSESEWEDAVAEDRAYWE